MTLHIGQVYRYPRPADPRIPIVDGLTNFFHATAAEGQPRLQLERGIYSPTAVRHDGSARVPLILIRSSPNKPPSWRMPWLDHFDLDSGRIAYYGDNKPGGPGAESAQGNALLLAQAELHLSPDAAQRQLAAPIVVFRAVTVDDRVKGNVRLEGLGVIEGVEKVMQTDLEGTPYGNFRFRFGLLDLAEDQLQIANDWLVDRRTSGVSHAEANARAPEAWRAWVDGSPLEELRSRRAPGNGALNEVEQSLLQALERRYRRSPHPFVSVAAALTEYLFGVARKEYRTAALMPDQGRFRGDLELAVGTAGNRVPINGVADTGGRATRLSAETVKRMVAGDSPYALSIVVTTERASTGLQSEVDHPIVDGPRICRVLEDLMISRGYDVEELLDLLENDPGSVVGPAVAGQAFQSDRPPD